jgi:hypothetical protein
MDIQDRASPRLTLKPAAPPGGSVDGAWWPRSRDLVTELPPLVEALRERLIAAERVTYHLGSWNDAPRRLPAEGYMVRLGGFRSQHPDTVTVIGTGGQRRLTLLVVPPQTDDTTAQQAMISAAQPDNRDTVEAMLDPHSTS